MAFQARILEQYEGMVKEYGLTVMDATKPVETQQRSLRRAIRAHLDRMKVEELAR